MNNINMSIQEIVSPKLKNDTDDDDAYHPSNDPPPQQSSYKLYIGKTYYFFPEGATGK